MDEQAHKDWERKRVEQPDWNALREQFGAANATFPTGSERDWANVKIQTTQPITFADAKKPLGFTTGPGMGAGVPPKAPNPPPWAGASWEEKVGRLRDEVAWLRVRSEWWVSETQRLQEMIERFIGHSHDALGHVVVPFRAQYGIAGVGQKAQSTFDPLA